MRNKFVKSTFILIIGGFVTKIISMVIRIVMTRLLGTMGIGLYMLVSPTFMLLISLASLGLPVAISKLVAEDSRNNKNLVFLCFPITLFINFLIMVVLIFFSGFISSSMLHEPRIKLGITCIGFVLPFISISSILRGYFFGKQRMIPHVVSNITEDLVRLIVISLGGAFFLSRGVEFAIAFIILSNIFSELTSIFVLFFFLPRNFKIRRSDLSFNSKNFFDVLSISLPTTGSRLIGNVGYFFEPIILTCFMLKSGYSEDFIVSEYGIINGYVLPLVLLPSFFTLAISQAIIPVISYNFSHGNFNVVRVKLFQGILFSLIIGIPATLILFFFPFIPLKLIYNTDLGINYIKVMSIVCLLHYVQSPISSCLQAMGKANDSMMGTFFGMIIRSVILIIGSSIRIGMWGLIISISINIIFVTVYDFLKVNGYLKRNLR
jgi:stage V sporulation protein B